MPPRKQPAGPDPADRAPPAASDEVRELRAAVERLADEVNVLRRVLDELRDDFAWALNNRDQFRCAGAMSPLTSMPKDPLATDFGERLNRFTAADLPDDPAGDDAPPAPAGPRDLF